MSAECVVQRRTKASRATGTRTLLAGTSLSSAQTRQFAGSSAPPVPHAAHFLERLDRVPRSLSDFALDLYRDEDRVRWILHYAHLPKEEERVALALGEAGAGPYLVVTREGKFVTALSAEMGVGKLTVLSRAQVDVFSARVTESRSRLELAKGVVPPGMEPIDILGLLKRRAWRLTREEMSAIAAWAPIIGTRFIADALDEVERMMIVRETFLTAKVNRSAPRTRAALDALWNATHALGARLVLATMGDLAFVEPWAKGWTVGAGPTYFATLERVHAVAMRGAWAAARMGKHFIPLYKRILSSPGDVIVRFDAALALTAIGIRHSHHRAEARRIVRAMVGSTDERNGEWEEALVVASERAFDDPEAATDDVVALGADLLIVDGKRLEDGHPFKFASEADVPRELALVVAANSVGDSATELAVSSLPWVAKLARAEELYYPDDMARALRTEWPPEFIEEVCHRRRMTKRPQVIREGSKLGRNDPCSCGSGASSRSAAGRESGGLKRGAGRSVSGQATHRGRGSTGFAVELEWPARCRA